MDNTINGRTPEEIKLGLEYCPLCNKSCPYHNEKDCYEKLHYDTLALINQLQEDKKQLERERDEARNDLDTLNYANTELHSAYEAMKRERDAAVADMTELMQLAQFCRHCKHITSDGECTFDFAANKGEPWCWQWRGVQEVE